MESKCQDETLCIPGMTESTHFAYRIRSNYRTVRLGFSKLLEKLLKYLPTYIKGTLKKRSAKDLSNYTYSILFLIFFIKAYVVGTHLNCIEFK